MMTANSEHARYSLCEAAKAAAIAETSAGMTREQAEAIVTKHTAGIGKAGRKSLRRAVYDVAGLGSPADHHEDKGHLTKSSRGTWAIAVGNTASALTRNECIARNLIPGPGND